MVINEIRLNEDSRRVQKAVQQSQQGQRTNWEKSLTWNDIWHMAPLRISSLTRSVHDLQPSNANLVRWRKKEDPTCLLCNGSRQTTEHVLSSRRVALSQGRYIWRHNRVLQVLAVVISMAKGQSTHPGADAVIFTQRKALSHGTEGRSSRQTRGNADLTGVTTGKFQQISQNGKATPV